MNTHGLSVKHKRPLSFLSRSTMYCHLVGRYEDAVVLLHSQLLKKFGDSFEMIVGCCGCERFLQASFDGLCILEDTPVKFCNHELLAAVIPVPDFRK